MKGLLKYNYKVYIKDRVFVIPLISLIAFQGIYYAAGKEKFLPAVIFCSNVAFLAMIWIGFIYTAKQDLRSEEVIYLKVRNDRVYWSSKIIFMIIVALLVTVLGVIWPAIRCYDMNFKNMIYAFFMQFICAVMGQMIGMILQVKVTKDKNKSFLYMIVIALVSIIKMQIIKEIPILKYVLWIMPPVNDLTFACTNTSSFTISLLGWPLLYACIYVFLEWIIYYKIMKKLLF